MEKVFLLASHNMKKRDELERILAPLGICVKTASQLGIDLTEAEETGVTFAENALIKAESGMRESGLPCVADDSGLAVDALGGEPGVYSARYAGEHGNDRRNTEKLLSVLGDLPEDKRTARYVSSVACVFPDGRVLTAEGTCEGKIAFAPRGNGGFGYDPVFLVGDKTMAELSDEEKDKISHRGTALRALARRLSEQ